METVHGELEIKKNVTETCYPRDPKLYHASEQLVNCQCPLINYLTIYLDVDSEDDSEYETEEVYELREWYPPDFWRAKDQDNANRVCQTDVTANNLTVTMLESRVCDGFFKAL